MAATINTLAGALYKVFCASPDLAMTEMRQACFDYLSIGGTFSSGPVALLSGLDPKPLNLVVHFFSVAIYGVGRLILPFPSLSRIWISARLIQVSQCTRYILEVLLLLSLCSRFSLLTFAKLASIMAGFSVTAGALTEAQYVG